MTDWQPIETAPQDGTPILVCREGCLPLSARRSNHWQWWIATTGVSVPYQPTHWMPIPAPPAVRSEDE